MINKETFFASVRASLFGGKLTQSQVDGMEAILNEWDLGDYDDERQLAYMLATVYHETDKKMQPIEEYGRGRGMRYGKRVKYSGVPYKDTNAIFYGRGFVQLTWYENYAKAGSRLGLDLIQKPELALNLIVATKILFAGMKSGWFTGKKLNDYFNQTQEDWVNARRIINVLDKAQTIAGYAKNFYAALK